MPLFLSEAIDATDLSKHLSYFFLVMQTVQLAKVALRAGAGNMVNGLLRAVVKHQVG